MPKKTIQIGEFITNFGLKDDAHAGDWHRLVSFLGQESIDRMTAQGIKGLGPGKFAENITTENIVLYELGIGDMLTIGETVFEVTQIGKESYYHPFKVFYYSGIYNWRVRSRKTGVRRRKTLRRFLSIIP